MAVVVARRLSWTKWLRRKSGGEGWRGEGEGGRGEERGEGEKRGDPNGVFAEIKIQP